MLISYPDRLEMLGTVPNTDDSKLFSNAVAALRRGLPELAMSPARQEPAVLCGGGPSLADDESIDRILRLKAAGAKIFALNNAAQILAENGIRADFQVVLDARPQNAVFVEADRADVLLLASQCHADVFDTALARGANVVVWNHGGEEYAQRLEKELGRTGLLMIGGSHTVGLCSMCLAYAMGFDRLDLFGYDSSHRDGRGHAYAQPLNANDQTLNVAVDGRTFTASVSMTAQARAFPDTAQMLADKGVEIHVHGDGLIPHIAKMMQKDAETKVMRAVYDLSCSPPTWEFVTFLAAAEDYRKQAGFDVIDLTFQPGPMDGFRADNLPPDAEEREAMLWRICIASARLIPSVRNVTRLKERTPMEADFPLGYSPDLTLSCYGAKFCVGADPVFQASPVAKRQAKKLTGDAPYIVIPVRQAEYWSNRNTDIETWKKAVKPFKALGWNVFYIPDTNGDDVPGEKNIRAASFDVDLRLALYEGAKLVTGTIGGAACFAIFSKANYLFVQPVNCGPSTEPEYLRQIGLDMENDWTPRGKIVFGSDALAAEALRAYFGAELAQTA